MGIGRKILFSGRSLLIVALWAALLGWLVLTTVHSGLVWDGSGLNLREARALVAELAPGTRVTFFGDAPSAAMLTPLARGTDRLEVVRTRVPVSSGQTPPFAAGDVRIVAGVDAGNHWLVLHEPDFRALLWALTLVSSPYAPTAVGPPPGTADSGLNPPPEATGRALTWAMSGLALPTAVCLVGLWWRRRRGGT